MQINAAAPQIFIQNFISMPAAVFVPAFGPGVYKFRWRLTKVEQTLTKSP